MITARLDTKMQMVPKLKGESSWLDLILPGCGITKKYLKSKTQHSKDPELFQSGIFDIKPNSFTVEAVE